MDNKIPTFTVFTFFFCTVSAARLTLDPPSIHPSAVWSNDASKSSHESVASADSNILLPKAESDLEETTANNRLPEPEKTQNDSTMPHTNFSRFHPVNRHFHGASQEPKQINKHRRPCRTSVTQYRIPRTQTSVKNDEIAARRTENSNPENFRGEVPMNWLKAKQHYGSRRHHNNQRSNSHNALKAKLGFDREKLKNLIRQHKQKKREEEIGFMKSIRKFLKHTFD